MDRRWTVVGVLVVAVVVGYVVMDSLRGGGEGRPATLEVGVRSDDAPIAPDRYRFDQTLEVSASAPQGASACMLVMDRGGAFVSRHPLEVKEGNLEARMPASRLSGSRYGPLYVLLVASKASAGCDEADRLESLTRGQERPLESVGEALLERDVVWGFKQIFVHDKMTETR